jgi:serine phosphatase RsbU (regulator of sigma subunit)
MIADIDLKHNKIKYSSAGHPSQILIHNDEVKLIKTGGKMIGVIDSFEYINLEDDFLSNSKLLLFTDGVFEEFSENGEELGEDGLIKIVENNIDKPITELTNCIVKSVNDFIEGSFINDDITIIGLELK